MEELYCKVRYAQNYFHTFINCIQQGAKVWLPDRLHVWVSGEVCSALSGEQLVVLADEGDEQCSRVIPVKDTSDLPPLRNPKLLVGANDLTTLSYLHEPAGMGVPVWVWLAGMGVPVWVWLAGMGVLVWVWLAGMGVPVCMGVWVWLAGMGV